MNVGRTPTLTAAQRLPFPARAARVDPVPRAATSPSLGTRLAVGKPSFAAALVAGDDLAAHRKGAPRKRRRTSTSRQHEAADVRGGDDLAVRLDERHDARLEALVRLQQRVSPCARWPKRKFSPIETRVARSVLDEHVLDEVGRAALRERSVERDHDELLDAQLATSSALRSSVVSSFGAASGRTTDADAART